ncbi:Bud-site selection protein [Fomitopsis serialis]|uniref:Bud-site selection protein n=1 Tax=Fomitopsis serialis TaxID=139415 RepID=UPI0020086A37|nr:Bud-site selection protein [Neoantrodia serialis]KAH9936304.1 Bud-site selection protein [Neoantrodia serialis]
MPSTVSATHLPHSRPQGVKRKRGKDVVVDPATKIRAKLHNGLKAIYKVAKKEKTFEIQKLIKKKKDAAGKQDNVNYDEQLAILKALDPEGAANLATKTKIGKDKFLSQNEFVKAAVEVELSSGLLVPSKLGAAAGIVESRFLSSKRMAAEIQRVLQVMKDELLGTSGSKTANASAPSKDKVRNDTTVRAQDATSPSDDEDDLSGEEDGVDVDVQEGAGWESGTVADSDGEDGWESGSVDDTAVIGGRAGNKATAVSDEDVGGLSEASDSSDTSLSPAAKRRKQLDHKASAAQAVPKDPKGKSKASAAESTFLPSLSVGFTRGDSDVSDWSDEEANAADGARKNRRGQRARRAIWEKKYGKNANHVKNAHGTSMRDGQRPSNRANLPGKGAPRRDGPDTRQHRPSAYAASRQPDSRRVAHEIAPPGPENAFARTKAREEKPLHPSWEAKKRLKERENPVILPAQGKKITFD